MGENGASLGRRQLRVIMEHVGQCLVNLADIVEEGDAFERTELAMVETSCVAEDQ